MPYIDLPGNKPSGSVNDGNSTTTALAAGATFTGEWADASAYPSLTVACRTDQAGAMYVDFSPDGTNSDSTITYAVSSTVGDVHRLSLVRKYFRVRFTNSSASPQTYMRLQCILGFTTTLSAPLNLAIQQDNDAITVRAIDYEFDIAAGRATDVSIVNKFGRNSDIDIASVPEDIWEGSGVYTGFPTGSAETLHVFSSSVNDASAGSGARTILISGLDANYAALSETITMNGTTAVTSVGSYLRVNNATVVTSGSSNQAFNAGTITVRYSATAANVFLSIGVGVNISNSSGYTVPAGYTAYMRYLYGAIQGSTSASADGVVWWRPFGASPQLRRPFTINFGTVTKYEIYGGVPFSEKSDFILRITSVSANNTVVTGGFDLIVVKN